MVFFGLREGAFNGSLVPIVLPARRLLLQRLSIPIAHIQLSQIRLGHLATSASFPLRLFAMAPMCVESTHKIAPRAGPFATHCRRISLKTCPAMLLFRKRRGFRLIAVAASAPARRFQSTEPFVRDVAVALSFWPPLRLYPLQASHKQHLKQDLSVHSGSAVICAVQRRTQIANEAEIHGAAYLSQQVILRQHLLHDRQVCLPLPHPAASILFAVFSSLLDIFDASPF